MANNMTNMEELNHITQLETYLAPFALVIIIVGIIGNLMTCIVIAKNQQIRTSTNFYLTAFSVIDLLLLVSGIITFASNTSWVGPGAVISVLLTTAIQDANALIVTEFIKENFMKIYNPSTSQTISTWSSAKQRTVNMWKTILVIQLPKLIFSHTIPSLMVLVIISVMSSYMLIYMGVKRGQKQTPSLKLQTTAFLIFLLKWVPIYVIGIYLGIFAVLHTEDLEKVVYLLVDVVIVYTPFFLITLSINPILFFMSSDFRKAFKDTICCLITGENRLRLQEEKDILEEV